jgi:cell division protein FtsL
MIRYLKILIDKDTILSTLSTVDKVDFKLTEQTMNLKNYQKQVNEFSTVGLYKADKDRIKAIANKHKPINIASVITMLLDNYLDKGTL